MERKMKAATMTKVGKIELREVPVPEVGGDEVLIKVKSVGICGSDLHYFESGHIGKHVVETPFILGHEASGEIVSLGADVSSLEVGDRVSLEPGAACGKCRYCLSGRYNLCKKMSFWATPPIQGVLSEYIKHKAHCCYRLGYATTYEEGALAEPTSVALHMAQRSKASAGKSALIIGAGPIGQATLQILICSGLTEIIVCDVIPKRLQLAKEMGASHTINGAKTNLIEDVNRITKNEGVDIVYETSGNSEMSMASVAAVQRGGRVVQVGSVPAGNIHFPVLDVVEKEITFIGNYRYANCYPTVLNLIDAKKIHLESLISHRFNFEKTQEAFLFARDHKEDCMKVMIALDTKI